MANAAGHSSQEGCMGMRDCETALGVGTRPLGFQVAGMHTLSGRKG